MNWYIGQNVVAIKNHSQGAFKKGEEFVIMGISRAICGKCDYLCLDIGVASAHTYHSCNRCGHSHAAGGRWLFIDSCFAPLDQDISELTDILKQPTKETIT